MKLPLPEVSVRQRDWRSGSIINFFLEVWNLVRKRLKGHQPCIAVYVDDIGISAIDVRKEQLERLYEEIVSVSVKHGLALNHEKREICGHDEYQEFVGIRLNKRRVSVGKKALSKEKRLRSCITDSQYSNEEKKGFRSSLKGCIRYKKAVQSYNRV
jgi:hypothetical protein